MMHYNNSMAKQNNYLSLPNCLSYSRLLAVPIMMWLAWYGSKQWFWGILGFMVITDVLDGWIARIRDQTTEFGAKLDSIADIFTYYGLTLCLWWLWPDHILTQKYFIGLGLLAYLVPVLVCAVKFKRLPSFHTWSAKFAAVAGVPVLILWIGYDYSIAVQAFTIFLAIVSLEMTLIVMRMKTWQSNVASVFHINN